MALYIAPENQKILWDMIQKTPIFMLVFPDNTSLKKKTTWFKEQIQTIYSNIPSIITREQLKQINRNTLSTMIQSLQNQPKNSVVPVEPVSLPIDRSSSFSRLQKENTPNNMEQIETQYRELFEKPIPESPDFSEKIEDDVITNMSELIEQHRKIREQELKDYGPPQQIADSQTPLIIESKEPIQYEKINVRELLEINKRLELLEKKLDEILEYHKKAASLQINI